MISSPEECGYDVSDGHTGNVTGGIADKMQPTHIVEVFDVGSQFLAFDERVLGHRLCISIQSVLFESEFDDFFCPILARFVDQIRRHVASRLASALSNS